MASGGGYKFRVYEIRSHAYEPLASVIKFEEGSNSAQSDVLSEECSSENGEVLGHTCNTAW